MATALRGHANDQDQHAHANAVGMAPTIFP